MFKKKATGMSRAERIALADCIQNATCAITSFIAFKLEPDGENKDDIKKDYFDAVEDLKETCQLFRNMKI